MSAPPSEAQRQVRSWGFSHVFTWSDRPNAHYPPHSHSGITTHLILSGTFTISYPRPKLKSQANGEVTQNVPVEKETFGPGARIDVDAGKVHEVWIGEEGCTYIVGENHKGY